MSKLKQVNLIPREALKEPLHRQLAALFYKKGIGSLLVVLVFSISLFSFFQLSTISRLQDQAAHFKKMTQNSKVKFNQSESQYLELEKTKSDLLKAQESKKEKLDLLLSASSSGRRYSALLAFISNLVPEDLWITHLVLSEAEIQLYGAATDNQLVSQFMSQLDDSHAFRNSHFASSEKQIVGSHTLYNFQMTTEPVWSSSHLQNGNPIGNEVSNEGKDRTLLKSSQIDNNL